MVRSIGLLVTQKIRAVDWVLGVIVVSAMMALVEFRDTIYLLRCKGHLKELIFCLSILAAQ
jgi:hypothetical protein